MTFVSQTRWQPTRSNHVLPCFDRGRYRPLRLRQEAPGAGRPVRDLAEKVPREVNGGLDRVGGGVSVCRRQPILAGRVIKHEPPPAGKASQS